MQAIFGLKERGKSGRRRKAKAVVFDGVRWDSKMEMHAYKFLRKNGLIKKAREGRNCHVVCQGLSTWIEVDFLLKDGTFVDIHYFDKPNKARGYREYRANFLNGKKFMVFGSLAELKSEFIGGFA